MAYVRKRTTKTGAMSTTLIEAYRDENGRPRQRILANLHGEPDTLRALARFEYQLVDLRKHRAEQWAEAKSGKFPRKIVKAFFAKLDEDLAAIERKIAVLKKHCTATADEIQVAIEDHKRALHDAEVLALGSLWYKWKSEDDHKALAAKLRRLRR